MLQISCNGDNDAEASINALTSIRSHKSQARMAMNSRLNDVRILLPLCNLANSASAWRDLRECMNIDTLVVCMFNPAPNFNRHEGVILLDAAHPQGRFLTHKETEFDVEEAGDE